MVSRQAARVLFVTRRFPPSVGGMETLAANVDQTLRGVASVELIALRFSSAKHLAWFLPFALARTALAQRRVTHIVAGDAIVWATIAPVIGARKAETAVMVHGLDLVFPNPLYQRWVRWALPRADRVVANSAATAAVAREHLRLDPARISVVNPGVRWTDDGRWDDRHAARAELVRRFGLDAASLIVVTLGRLVRRKGVTWFVRNVVPELGGNVTFLVAGDGPMREPIEAAAERSGIADRVNLLGGIDEELRELLLGGCDLFVMPNIRVVGDAEGFGLVAVEAAARGALVLASTLEGITDAVIDGATGILVEPENATMWVETIEALARDRGRLADLAESYQQEARTRFSIERMAELLPAAIGLGQRRL